VTAADIETISVGSDSWRYERELEVGGTLSIRNTATGAERWSLSTARGAGHQIQQVSVDGHTHAIQHDASGHVAVDGVSGYAFDPRGQLGVVSSGGNPVESYMYDISGRLVAILRGTSGRPEQVFAYDDLQMVAAFDSSNRPLWEAHWGPGIDTLIGWRDIPGNPSEHIPLTDSRNSVVATWQPDTARVSSIASYDPEGRIELSDPSGNPTCAERGTGTVCANPGRMPFGYMSAWRSARTGLVHMRNRWYSPELTQFLSPDPLGYPDSYNAYAYAGFDPINHSDPLGLNNGNTALNLEPAEPVRQWPRLVPDPPPEASPEKVWRAIARGAARFARGAARLGARLGFLGVLLVPTNDTSPICVDEFCKNVGSMDAWDRRSGQPVSSAEVGARMSLPDEHPGTNPGAQPSTPSPPSTPQVENAYPPEPGRNTPYQRKFFKHGNYAAGRTRADLSPDCQYCGGLAESIEHIDAAKLVYELYQSGAITWQEAFDAVDALENLMHACKSCNPSKGARELGIQWNPKNPSEFVKQLLRWAKNPSTRRLHLNLSTGGHGMITPLVPPFQDLPNECNPKSLTCR
jgi:RHS repeat-associated protein